jgi:hypothetical protein|tara:strand:+ start:528 stop:1055 length:528 start_codon:yes stop_codon:yes gene_type:complete
MRWLCLSLSASLVAPYTHVPIPQPLTHAPIKSRYMSQTACAASSTWKLQSLKMSTSAQAQLSGGDDDAVYVAALEDAAQKCLDEGCPVDLLEEVVAHLKAESLELTRRQQAMLILIGKLDALATAPASKAGQSEIKKMVGGLARAFTKTEDYHWPGEALGYSQKPTRHDSFADFD